MICSHPILNAYVHLDPIDFRAGIDRLVGMCSNELRHDPRSGSAFVFVNSKQTSIKILYYDGSGYWLCQKRFSTGKMKHWPKKMTEAREMTVDMRGLMMLLFDGNLSAANFRKDFHPVNVFS